MAARRRSLRGRALSVLGWTLTSLATVACAVVLLGLALSRGWQREWLRASLETALSGLGGLEVSIGALEGPLYPDVTLREVRVASTAGRVLELPELRARLDARAVLRRKLVIESLSLASPLLELERDEHGRWSSGGVAQDERVPLLLPLELELHAFELHDARFEVRWRRDGRSNHVRGGLDASGNALALRRDASFEAPTRATATLRLDDAEVPSLELPGRWSGRAQLAMQRPAGIPLEQSEVSGEVALTADAAVGRGASQIELRGALRAGSWVIEAARASTPFASAQLEGRGDLQRIERLAGQADVDELARLAALVPGAALLQGSARLRFDLAGAWRSPEGTLDLALRELRARGVEIGSVDLALAAQADRRIRIDRLSIAGPKLQLASDGSGSIAIDERGVSLDAVRLRSEQQELVLQGRVAAGQFEAFSLQTTELALEPVLALVGLPVSTGGRLSGSLRFDGALTLPAIHGEGHWTEARLGGFEMDRLEFRVATRKGRLQAELALEDARRGNLEVSIRIAYPPPAGVAALLRSGSTRIRIGTAAFDLAGTEPWAPRRIREIGGHLAADLELRGRELLPELRGTLTVTRGRLGLEGVEAAWGPIDGTLEVAADAIHIDDLRIAGLAGGLHVRGDATLSARPRGEHAIRIAALRVETPSWQVWTDGPADLQLSAEGLHVKRLRLGGAAGALEFDGRLGLDGMRDLHLRTDALDLAALASLTGVGEQLGGHVAADIRLAGAYALPAIRGEIEWSAPTYGGVRAERMQLSLTTEGSSLRGSAELDMQQGDRLYARWSLPYRAPLAPATWLSDPATHVELEAAALDVALLAPFAPRFVRRPQGTLALRAELRGAANSPDLRGELELSRGSVHVPALRQTYAPITGRIVLSRDAVSIESLEVGTADVGARLTGSIALSGGIPSAADLELRTRALHIGGERGMSADVDGELRMQGPLGALVLRGALGVTRGRLALSEADDRLMREIRVSGLPDTSAFAETGPAGPFRLSELDLSLDVGRNSRIRAEGAALEVEGKLRIRRRASGDTSYTGALRVVRGSYRIQGREFEIRHGVASFTGGADLDPVLDATGIYRVQGISILASLRGRASAPEVKLSSDPALPEDDILSYLAFGKPRNELRGAGGTDLTAKAAALAGGLAANELSEELRDLTPLDVLDIGLDESTGAPSAAIGKYITDDIFVRYGQDLRVEWTLSPSFRVESEVTSDEKSGVDLIWQHDY